MGGSRAVALYLPEIVRLVSGYLDSPRWVIKHASALAVGEIVTSFEGEISNKDGEVVWRVLEKALAGKSWEGKEEVLKAFVRFTRNSRQFWGPRTEIGDQMKVGWCLHFFCDPWRSRASSTSFEHQHTAPLFLRRKLTKKPAILDRRDERGKTNGPAVSNPRHTLLGRVCTGARRPRSVVRDLQDRENDR